MKRELTKIERLKKRLSIVENELDKCRTSTMKDGWQTQRFSKKSRRWDILAQEKIKLLGLIDDEELTIKISTL
jgi:allantoicase